MHRPSAALAASLTLLLAAAAPAAAQRSTEGAPGAGDPFFPQAGNGGYDVRHYDLELDYAPGGDLTGRAEIRATATQRLDAFNLDLRDFLAVSRVSVNGRRAGFSHAGQELVIEPRRRLKAGRRFTVAVEYAGTPQPVVDPDESIEGWIPTDDGAFVVNEPQGSPGWYPVNDTPRDKATYDFAITVPAGSTALANGVLVGREDRGESTVWRWSERSPMAPYLATATNGPFETRFGQLASGLLEYNAVDPDTRESGALAPNPGLAWDRLARQEEIVDFFVALYGPYPFESVGAIVDWAPEVGYALESQTKANYHRTPGVGTIVHEVAHQWFGNSVTLSSWPDIWLNEGFATWSQWIYDERHGGVSAQARFDELYAREPGTPAGDALWALAPAALPGPEELFARTVYDRGAMTLQALRAKVGEEAFFAILRTWYAEHRDGNVDTADFVALAERVSEQELDAFFRVWLYETGRPSDW